eukprot:3910812-Pyramimonas_sp.AAC.1
MSDTVGVSVLGRVRPCLCSVDSSVFAGRPALRASSAACIFACSIAWMSCRYDGKVLASAFSSRARGCTAVSGSVGEG